MKITDPDIIKNSENDLIDAVKNDLDQDVIRQILKKRIAHSILSAKGGEIVVHNSEIAFRVDFDLNLSGSLMFDRQGNYLDESDEDLESDEDPVSDEPLSPEEPLEADEPIELDDPMELEDPLELTDALEPDEPVVSDDPTQLDESLELDEPTELDDPFGLDEPSELDDPLGLDEPSELDDPIELDELAELNDPKEEDDPEALLSENIDLDEVDEDIDDILQESQDFWEQKKE